MNCLSFYTKYFIIIATFIGELNGFTTFIASFQPSLNGSSAPSTKTWIRYNKKIPSFEEFTACHWIKVRYFGRDIAIVPWSYCIKESIDSDMNCIQLFFKNKRETANRHLRAYGYFPWSRRTNMKVNADLLPYAHRSWFHFCWSFSTIVGQSKMYYNGKLVNSETLVLDHTTKHKLQPQKIFQEALIFGQEPDDMMGEFDPLEAFIGDLSEFNIWNFQVQQNSIQDMAKCKKVKKGNIVSWDKENWEMTEVAIEDGKMVDTFCKPLEKIILFPQKKLFKEARRVCEVHGGALAVPKSDTEQKYLMKMFRKYSLKCGLQSVSGSNKLAWLGAVKKNKQWYSLTSSGKIGESLKYSRWESKNSFSESRSCSYITSRGDWGDGKHVTCNMEMLCFACQIKNVPVFTLKGICPRTKLDWNYYAKLNNFGALDFYDGYKQTNIKYDNGKWVILMKDGTSSNFKAELSVENTADYPLGRHEWIINDPNCDIREGKRNMTISKCDFGHEFTCYSGHCIRIDQRCDERTDCYDGSDEEDCTFILIPKRYQETLPPAINSFDVKKVEINTQLSIISIDEIDTLRMMVGLTIQINIQWLDQRLEFHNPIMNQENIIPQGIAQRLWLPIDNIVHENAIIGHIENGVMQVSLLPSLFENMDVGQTEENRILKGGYNLLQMTQRFHIKYNCLFDVEKFPFDKGACNFTASIKSHKHVAIRFKENSSIIYLGPPNVHQFTVGEIATTIENSNESSKYIFSIALNRNFTNQLIATFIPTFILLLLAYSTLFINIEHSSDRLMVTVTSLLVFAALLDSINQDLPKTSYIKYVDMWFVMHITGIFIMIIYHIILDSISNGTNHYHGIRIVNAVAPIAVEDRKEKKGSIKRLTKENINKVATIIIPFIYTCFYAIYFYKTT